ncbi:sigma 54-interacting transcriptional regulator [Ancylobacter dichloromethanicus]
MARCRATSSNPSFFGYEAGAFTGAHKNGKPGMLELANHGTLFLDEIGELPLDMQVKLLHVLQDRTVARLGSTRSMPLDIRIVAATNRDLARAVEASTFRADLFYRLNVVPIVVPPLRERREDILPLIRQALSGFNAQYRTHKQFFPCRRAGAGGL